MTTLWAAERVVVLTNGNVLQGDVQQLADHVVVTTKHSELRVPRADVDLVTSSLVDVYRDKSAKLPTSATTSRAQFIRWCLRHGLRTEAEREFERLQHYHPDYHGLAQLRRLLQDSPQSLAGPTVLPAKSPPHQDYQFAKQNLTALSRQTLGDFVKGVQPLLTNKCSQAGCHGMSSNSTYTLMTSSLSRFPQPITYRNLGATLRRIGNDPAEQSLLWMSARSAHGGLSKPALNAAELEKLSAWIHGVNRDRGVETGVARTVAKQDLQEATDPFDPEHFNRIVHAKQDAANAEFPSETEPPSETPSLD